MPRRGLFFILFALVAAFLLIKIIPKLKSREIIEFGMDIETKKSKKKLKTEDLKPPLLTLAMLDENYGEKTFSIGRNIFRYGPPKTQQVPQIPGANIDRTNFKTPPKVVHEPLVSEVQTPTTVIERQQKKEPPSFTFKYLGFFGPLDKKLAVFSDGKDIIDVFEGETISDKFILKKIGFESVTIGFVGFPEDITQKIEVGQ